MRKIYYILTFIILILFTLKCSKSVGGGGTIETTNGVVGSIKTEDDLPEQGAIVKLIPLDYDPVNESLQTSILTDTTDEDGNYSFSNLTYGMYNIIVRQIYPGKSLIIRNINVSEGITTKAPKGILKKSATITIKILSLSKETNKESYIYIPGTDIFSYLKDSIVITLENIPLAEFAEIILRKGDDKKYNILRDKLLVKDGEEKIIEWSLLNYKRRIALNTTVDGANVQKNVYNFPLLIRLDKNNFDFSTIDTNRIDIIFTKEDNTILKSEIERWDDNSKKAEIWVLVDTIYGNDSSQSIFMHWNYKEEIGILPDKIFDTLYGFQGVWHFGESKEDTLLDATQNSYYGISSENSKPTISEGIIGRCRYFDGIDDFITMPNTANSKLNFPENGYYTVYAWVLLDTLDGNSHCIVSKGYEQYYLRTTYISPDMKLTTPYWEFVEFSETEKWRALITPVTSQEWCLIVGVRNGNQQFLYCNGELMDTTIDYWKNNVSRNIDNDLTIGRFAKPVTIPINEGYCPFKGYIDEVRIINMVQTPEWIKLCYMNQRVDDRLTRFK